MNKRERVLGLLDASGKQDYVPAAFFIHFDKACHQGQAAIDKHLEYFRYTGMDFVKIQYEAAFPPRPEIESPDDWSKMPLYGRDFYEGQLNVVKGLVEEAKEEALVIVTLYSPFMCAGQTTRHTPGSAHNAITNHIKENPEKAKKGMEIVTESLMIFVRECIELGVDGFYASTQGGESHRFEERALFEECIKPYDLVIMEEINRRCVFNILHICDYHDMYDDLTTYLDYPGHVVNCSLELESQTLTGEQVSRMFGRPYMGGLDRKGVIVHGNEAQIREAVEDSLSGAPDRYILAADCTLPSDIDWNNIKTAISAAHEGHRER